MPEPDIPVEIERRQVRLAAIFAAKARLEERQRQLDVERGCTEGYERTPEENYGMPRAGKPYQRDLGVPPPKA